MGKKWERLSNIQKQKSFQNGNSPHQLLPLVKSSSQDFYTWNLTPACLVNYGNPTWKPLFPCVNLFARCCPPTALLFSSWQALPEGPEERGIHREPSHRSRRCQLEEARLVPTPLGLHFFKDKWLARLNITQGLCREEFPGLEGLLGALQADSAHGFLLWGLWRGLEAHRCCLKSQAEFASRAQTFFIASYLLWSPHHKDERQFLVDALKKPANIGEEQGCRQRKRGSSWTKAWLQLMLSFNLLIAQKHRLWLRTTWTGHQQ